MSHIISLTTQEMPAHNHRSWGYYWAQGGVDGLNWSVNNNVAYRQYTENTGGNQPHENRPASKSAFIYKRSA